MVERRLGRGLGSLIAPAESSALPESPAEIDLARILPNPKQPRRTFDETALSELATSLREHGVLQPVVVRETATGFELISGERRWRAAKLAGLSRIPATIRRNVSDDEMLELALVENVQRQDLDPIERARGFRAMVDQLDITQDDVARKVGLQRTSVANHLRLLDLPAPVQDALSRGLLSFGHARAILGIDSAVGRVAAMERAVREGLSVRQVEELSRKGAATDAAPSRPGNLKPHAPWVVDLEARLREALGTKVAIRNGRRYRGQIVIEYFDRAGLDRLCAKLAPKGPIS
jgi:ParB family chromosome partitioning protein